MLHNVLTGVIKVADLGFTILLKDVNNVGIAGTKGYMAPELNMDPPIRGPWNDIFSTCMSFLRLLTDDTDFNEA